MRNRIDVIVCPADHMNGGLNEVAGIEFLDKFDVVILEEFTCDEKHKDEEYQCRILVKDDDKEVLQKVREKLNEFGICVKKEVKPQLNPELFPANYRNVTMLIVYENYPEVALPFMRNVTQFTTFFCFSSPAKFPLLRSKKGEGYVLGGQKF